MGRTIARAFTSREFTVMGKSSARGALPNAPASRTLGSPTTVSIIVPTWNRHDKHEALYRCFQEQDYHERDMWVLDDSPEPSPFFCSLRNSDERLHYIHTTGRQSIGYKRNQLIAMARGDVIAHFDDDDCYKPPYLSSMLDRLARADADFVKLARWNERREWDNHRWTYDGNQSVTANLWGWGFSYVYRRWVTSRVSFPHINGGEDYSFVRGLQKAGMKSHLVFDGPHWLEHVLHGRNTTRKG
jgi:glycosyltransferase involved in cell wall biosynthesis